MFLVSRNPLQSFSIASNGGHIGNKMAATIILLLLITPKKAYRSIVLGPTRVFVFVLGLVN